VESEFLTVRQVAEYLNISTFTVKKLVKKGHLKVFGIGGGLRRYRKSDVDDMVESLSKREATKK